MRDLRSRIERSYNWRMKDGKCKTNCARRSKPPGDSARRESTGGRGEDHARPQGPQRGSGQEIRLPHDHQGRRDRGQGDRVAGCAGEHGRPDGARSGVQDFRRGRRRHHHGDRAGAVDLPRGREDGGRGRQSDGREARHRDWRSAPFAATKRCRKTAAGST